MSTLSKRKTYHTLNDQRARVILKENYLNNRFAISDETPILAFAVFRKIGCRFDEKFTYSRTK